MSVAIVLQILVGLTVGYITGSFVESMAHQHISDAPHRHRLFWRRHPKLFRQLIETYYSHHVVHHVRTFRVDHITQFSTASEKVNLDAALTRRGHHGKLIKQAKYAMKLQGDGAFTFVAPLLAAWPCIWVVGGAWVALGAVLTLALPPVLSNWMHPYLHMPHWKAREASPKWIAWLLGTRYGRAMARNHFLHHRYEDCCFNLVLGADYLRGTHRWPSPEDVAEMRRIGIPLT